MEPFLRELARLLLHDHGHELADVAVVLPSQRAGLYLRRHLAEVAGGTLWSPQVLTITGFAERISGLRVAPTTDLLFEAYRAYQESIGATAAPFSEFLQWAPTALRDMSEVDAHLIPLDAFYRDLRNWEELDWSFNVLPLSMGQERMVRYWTMKGGLHRTLNEHLREHGLGTAGLVERVAVEHAAATGKRTGWTKVWAAGLNALSPAQQAILLTLQQQGLLELAWDADQYYLEDEEQEAGTALRNAIAALGGGRIAPTDHLRTLDRRLQVVTVPNNVAQVHFAVGTLQDLSPEDRAHTAVVLADEQLLMPLLDALPPDIGPVNVTMGMPLNALPVGGLLSAVVNLHREHRSGSGYRLADVDLLLGHPLLASDHDRAVVRGALRRLKEDRRMHVTPNRIVEGLAGLTAEAMVHAEALFARPATDGAALGKCLLHALSWAHRTSPQDAFAQEQLFLAAQAQQRLNILLERHAMAMDAVTYAEVHQRVLREERIGLFGEPLSGVQVMGVLETRALDLDRVILLSAQEGTLPPASSDRSFIPFELRRAHGLPLRHRHDGVSAYHFLRGIQRSSDVVLTLSSGEGSTGPSRFILQLEHELAQRADHTTLSQRYLQAPVPSRRAATVVVEKDAVALDLLHKRLSKGLSPSALSKWLRCPLDLYFTHLLGLRGTDEAEEQIAADLMGTALHTAIEAGYRPWVGHTLTAQGVSELVEHMPAMLVTGLEQVLGREALSHGQPLLQRMMAEQAAVAFVRQEAERLAQGSHVELVGLEEDLRVALPFDLDAHGVEVNIVGRVDRIERRDGELLILDLKSGSVKAEMLRLKTLDADELRPEKDHYALQLLVYAWAYLMQHPEEPHVKAGLVPLQRASEAAGLFLQVDGSTRITRDRMPAIEALLHRLIERLLDPSEPFTHRADSHYCEFCLA